MAKFRFAQEKQITTWVRDYYEVEADSLDDAIAIVEEASCSLEELGYNDKRVEFVENDEDFMYEDWNNDFPDVFRVISCDTEEEIVEGY
jgi:DNA polymerase III sliding clamp (beta) subunit (PCNA family)